MIANKKPKIQYRVAQIKAVSGDDSADGLARLLGSPTRRIAPIDWIFMIRNGFCSETLDSLAKNIRAGDVELAAMLGVSVRTLAQLDGVAVSTPPPCQIRN